MHYTFLQTKFVVVHFGLHCHDVTFLNVTLVLDSHLLLLVEVRLVLNVHDQHLACF